MRALMLAAEIGKRLGRYTAGNTKCMLKVGDKTLIERACEELYNAGVKAFTIVVGYKWENLKKYLKECDNEKTSRNFIDNDVNDKTNNIYSLYMVKDDNFRIKNDFLRKVMLH